MTLGRSMQHRGDSVQSALIICTKNRADELANALAAWRNAMDHPADCLIVDASDQSSRKDNELLAAQFRAEHVPALRPGLARQRNQALDVLRRRGGYDIVHFIDDDTRVDVRYFYEIEAAFAANPTVAGAGAIVLNQELPRAVGVKSLFGLYSSEPGKILQSGRNTIGHYPEPGTALRNVEWLPGCCMSYRLSSLQGIRFDDRLTGYSWGEDFDFSYRLRAVGDLVIVPTAHCLHDVSPRNRLPSAELATERTQILHRWVHENRPRGLSLHRFWLSVVGEIVLRVLDGRQPESRAIARGVFVGCVRQLNPRTRLRPLR